MPKKGKAKAPKVIGAKAPKLHAEVKSSKEKDGSAEDSRLALVHRLVTSPIKEDYVDIKMAPGKTGTAVMKLASPMGDREYARTLLGSKPIKTQMVQVISASVTTANTACTTVFSPDMALASDIASWLNLFDEVRCLQMHCRWVIGYNFSGTVPTPQALWTAAFDPAQSSAVSSHSQNIKATKHVGPVIAGLSTGISGNNGTVMLGPLAVTQEGHYALSSGKLHAVLPPSSGGVLSPSPVGGNWVPTNSAAMVTGYLKFYGDAPGASVAWTVSPFFIYDVEFRIRG